MYGNLFVRRRGEKTLDEFAGTVYECLGVTKVEKRTSSNYLDDTYFVGTALAINLGIALSDEAGYEEYDFWLWLERAGPSGGDDAYLEQCGDAIARVLAAHGYDVSRSPDWASGGRQRMRYVKETINGRDRISTQAEEVKE